MKTVLLGSVLLVVAGSALADFDGQPISVTFNNNTKANLTLNLDDSQAGGSFSDPAGSPWQLSAEAGNSKAATNTLSNASGSYPEGKLGVYFADSQGKPINTQYINLTGTPDPITMRTPDDQGACSLNLTPPKSLGQAASLAVNCSPDGSQSLGFHYQMPGGNEHVITVFKTSFSGVKLSNDGDLNRTWSTKTGDMTQQSSINPADTTHNLFTATYSTPPDHKDYTVTLTVTPQVYLAKFDPIIYEIKNTGGTFSAQSKLFYAQGDEAVCELYLDTPTDTKVPTVEIDCVKTHN